MEFKLSSFFVILKIHKIVLLFHLEAKLQIIRMWLHHELTKCRCCCCCCCSLNDKNQLYKQVYCTSIHQSNQPGNKQLHNYQSTHSEQVLPFLSSSMRLKSHTHNSIKTNRITTITTITQSNAIAAYMKKIANGFNERVEYHSLYTTSCLPTQVAVFSDRNRSSRL